MKKIYQKPETESIRIKMVGQILVESNTKKKYGGWGAQVPGMNIDDNSLMA